MNKLYGVINGAYLCNMARTEELNERLYSRNIPSAPLQQQFSIRPVPTKYTKMMILDQRQKSEVPIQQEPTYNIQTTFNPGNSR